MKNNSQDSQAAIAQTQAHTQAAPVTASIMRDDGGDKPAFCVMAAFRTEPEAVAALDAMNGLPAQPRTPAEPVTEAELHAAEIVMGRHYEHSGRRPSQDSLRDVLTGFAAGRAAPPAEPLPVAAWLHKDDPTDAISDAKKRGLMLHNGMPGKKVAANYTVATYLATPAPSQQAAPTPATQAEGIDTARMDWLEQQAESYGFENEHHGNRWHVEGAYRTLRDLIDAARAAIQPKGAPEA